MNVISIHRELPVNDAAEVAINTLLGLIRKKFSLTLTLSSGKDSTTTTLLGLEAIRRASIEGIDQAKHYISSSSTGVESPEIEHALLNMHDDIRAWAEKTSLPVDVRMVYPALTASFAVKVIGRGTLPRFVENGSSRACSVDWKVQPQQRLAKQIIEENRSGGRLETVSVLGTRFEESSVRGKSMRRRGEQAQEPVRSAEGFLTLSPIAEWSESQVWEFLSQFLDQNLAPFPSFVLPEAIRNMLDVYRDANDGTCGMFLSDSKRAPCGSRFGCTICTITGDADKSMESLLNSDIERYGYMQGLNDFRNYLVATQWDMSRREMVGRTVSDAGYVAVRPDVYSLQMRMDLLRYLLTIDEIEQERAEVHDGLMATGQLPDTPHNQRMREPQFNHITFENLTMIDWFWSMHHYAPHAFPALAVWYDVKVLGRRYPVPKLPTAAKESGIPPVRWYYVGAWDAEAPVDGLRDYLGEMWSPYLNPERAMTHRMIGRERGPWFVDGESSMEVDALEAGCVIDTYADGAWPLEVQHHHAIESARFWLDKEIVKLPPGMAPRYHNIAKRGQYFSRLCQRLNCTPAELDTHLVKNSISDADHQKLLAPAYTEPALVQEDLFAA